MIDDFAKEHLHEHLRWVREALAWKLDGLRDYDIRRPLTPTGTSLLGLVKHCAVAESRYFGEVFGRPFPEPLPRWDDEDASETEFWAAGHETREDIVGLYQRVQRHSDATIIALPIDAPGYVPWWREEVKLFAIMAHVLSDATRHAGHADILREQLDGATGVDAESAARDDRDSDFWAARRATVERAAQAAGRRAAEGGAAERGS